jgi:CMP/dCMP kinase
VKNLTIAIDGFSSCGKSSFAKLIAADLEFIYIDSGAMYRAFTLFCMKEGAIANKEIINNRLEELLNKVEIGFTKDRNNQNITLLNGKNVEVEIREMDVTEMVSPVSKIKNVRKKMVGLQQELSKGKGVVMDGRDIGTVVFPGADIKIFMTANADIRAERRYKENLEKGLKVDLEEIKANLLDRDCQDQNRKESPLRKADDAVVLDNSYMKFDEQMDWFRETFKEILEG